MTDCCWVRMRFRVSDFPRINGIFGDMVTCSPFNELEEEDSYFQAQINEINYAASRQREEMTKAKIPFHGEHGAGSEYGGDMFASFDGEMVELSALESMPVITVTEEDLTCLENVTAAVTRHVSGQIKRIRKYFDFRRKVEEAFREDVQVTSA